MNVERFRASVREAFSSLPDGNLSGTEAFARNYAIQELAFYCKRLSTPQIGLVLNLAAAALEADECFLNIGVWEGYSFFAPAVGNEDKLIVGVDNFSELDGASQSRMPGSPVRHYGPTRESFYWAWDRVRTPRSVFLERDWRDLLETFSATFPGIRIGAVFYDAEHTPAAHEEFFALIAPLLSRRCIILVDDVRHAFVADASRAFLRANDDFCELLSVSVPNGRHPAWWGGLQVLARPPLERLE